MARQKDEEEKYFNDSNSWERNQAIESKKSERRAWLVAGGFGGLAFLSVGAVLGLTPLKTSEPYVIRVNETTGVVDVVKSMKDAKTTYDEVVRKADLRKYVRARESYSLALAEMYYTTVGLMSSPDMAGKYQEFYNPQTNPKTSPLVKYGEAGSVVVDIKSVSFINDKAASINYIKKEYPDQLGTTQPVVSEWVATVTYKYVGLPQSDADREMNPFGFQAIEYRNDPVSASKAGGVRMKKVAACLALIAAQAAFAGVIPKPSAFDSRVRIAEYNPLDVYEVTAHYGYEVHIWLNINETIMSITAGDDLGWTIGPKRPRNHVFLKPKEDKPMTNMTIVSVTAQGEERVYVFDLKAEWPSGDPAKIKDMMYHIRFTYPEQEAKARQEARQEAMREDQVQQKLTDAASEKVRNYRYSFAGSTTLEPEEIYDNGTFTYIKWPANRDIPAIYHVNEDGSEQMTDYHGDNEYQVVHRVSERLIFRRGNAVAGVFNDAFDSKGTFNRTGTVSPDVKRVLKGGE